MIEYKIKKNQLNSVVRKSIKEILSSRSERLNSAISPFAGLLAGEGLASLMKVESKHEKLLFIGLGSLAGLAAGAKAFNNYNKIVKRNTVKLAGNLNENMFANEKIKERLLQKIQRGGYTHAFVNMNGDLILTKKEGLEKIIQRLNIGRARIPLE
ncbi:MAG: hypothetical protein M1594_02465 [Candidatus Marsarchaeota archaeon]|nr:hypothetical protein [Candidatus Marsarchaeota archaeon]